MAVNRFHSLLRRFKHQQELDRDYEAAMQTTLDQGYASRLEVPSDAKYFLAHHGVCKGEKLRLVFDAAAPFRGKSLNYAIIGGPALQPALAAVTRSPAFAKKSVPGFLTSRLCLADSV